MSSLPLNNILFIDIETVPQHDGHEKMPDEWKALWELKATYLIRNKEGETAETIYPRAGIYAEFGKIICISCGVLQPSGSEKKLVVKSFCGDGFGCLCRALYSRFKKFKPDKPKLTAL